MIRIHDVPRDSLLGLTAWPTWPLWLSREGTPWDTDEYLRDTHYASMYGEIGIQVRASFLEGCAPKTVLYIDDDSGITQFHDTEEEAVAFVESILRYPAIHLARRLTA